MRKLISMLVMATVATTAGLVVTTAPASAASSCNSTVIRLSNSLDPLGDRLEGLIPSVSGSTNCVLSVGNQSSAVRALQATLNRCFAAGIAEDGVFGNQTRTALINAQGIVGVTKDGVYGPNTRTAINNASRWKVYSPNLPNTYCRKVNL